MDDDLEGMEREQLVAEVRKLRAAIRVHRDSSGHAMRSTTTGRGDARQ